MSKDTHSEQSISNGREGGRDEDKPAAKRGSPFLNTPQAAHYLGLSKKTLEKFRVIGGSPKFRRHGNHVVYHIKDLDDWSEGTTHITTHTPAPVADTGATA